VPCPLCTAPDLEKNPLARELGTMAFVLAELASEVERTGRVAPRDAWALAAWRAWGSRRSEDATLEEVAVRLIGDARAALDADDRLTERSEAKIVAMMLCEKAWAMGKQPPRLQPKARRPGEKAEQPPRLQPSALETSILAAIRMWVAATPGGRGVSWTKPLIAALKLLGLQNPSDNQLRKMRKRIGL